MDRRQLFPNPIPEEYAAIQAQPQEAPIVGCEAGQFFVLPNYRAKSEETQRGAAVTGNKGSARKPAKVRLTRGPF
jgi:hypothetical protein